MRRGMPLSWQKGFLWRLVPWRRHACSSHGFWIFVCCMMCRRGCRCRNWRRTSRGMCMLACFIIGAHCAANGASFIMWTVSGRMAATGAG